VFALKQRYASWNAALSLGQPDGPGNQCPAEGYGINYSIVVDNNDYYLSCAGKR
jgi:hypothetical protein